MGLFTNTSNEREDAVGGKMDDEEITAENGNEKRQGVVKTDNRGLNVLNHGVQLGLHA